MSFPVRVVLFASEQLMPAMQFLLHLKDRFGSDLSSIHIYATSDERRSAGPARRLETLLKDWGLGLTIHLTVGEMWPQDVRKGLTDWFEDAPESLWLVNVTGGTKPMSAAAAELTLATDLTARRVLYQELTGQWVELCLDAQGLLDVQFLSAATEPLVPPADVLERMLKVKDLVAAQFSETHQITTQPVLPMDVAQAVEHLIHRHWHWKDALSAMAVACTSNGDAFERFIGAGLQCCGVEVQHSLKVQDRIDPSKVVREVDLVGCSHGAAPGSMARN